jgi:phage-related protein
MNAYRGDTLKNRFVSGDMSKFKLKPGANTLSWTGTITRLDIADESRWL